MAPSSPFKPFEQPPFPPAQFQIRFRLPPFYVYELVTFPLHATIIHNRKRGGLRSLTGIIFSQLNMQLKSGF